MECQAYRPEQLPEVNKNLGILETLRLVIEDHWKPTEENKNDESSSSREYD